MTSSRGLVEGLASGLGLCGASPFLSASQDFSVGSAAAAPLSTQGGTGQALFSLLPPCCVGLRGGGERSCWLCG